MSGEGAQLSYLQLRLANIKENAFNKLHKLVALRNNT